MLRLAKKARNFHGKEFPTCKTSDVMCVEVQKMEFCSSNIAS